MLRSRGTGGPSRRPDCFAMEGRIMRMLIASVIFCLAASAAAETPSIEWTRQFGTTGRSNDIAFAVATDGTGSSYVVGQVFGTLTGQTSAGASDAFVRKYDAAGNE